MGAPERTDGMALPHGRYGAPAYALLGAVLLLLAAGLVVYSQTYAFAWDEGFHILTAYLIGRGKRPYIDFCFSQTPLNAYWNAGWMALCGESWRVLHAVAALCTAGAVTLTAGFVFVRFPVGRWRLAGALVAALLTGMNAAVVQFGTVAQAYGLGLLAIVGAFLLSILCIDHAFWWAAAAGFMAGAAADSTLLTAPVSPVLLGWVLLYNRTGNRWSKLAAFVFGEAAAFTPVVWLFLQGPRQVFFGIVEYNLRYRQLDWPGATFHNVETWLQWIDCGPALLLALLATGGLLFVWRRSDWELARKRELYLCAWLSAALLVYISIVRPTFARYYVFSVPFLSILGVAGLYDAGSRLYRADRPWVPSLVLAALLTLGLGKLAIENRDDFRWADLEKIARKVDEVTPRGQPLFADEAVYFLTRRQPPSGMEMRDSHRLKLPPALNAVLHLLPKAELNRQIQAGRFSTVQTCLDEEEIKDMGLERVYVNQAKVEECVVYWDRRNPKPGSYLAP